MGGELDGKVAVITGGTRGLGLASAQAFTRAGAAVVVASRSEGAILEAVKALREQGARADGLACDVGDLAQVEALAAFARTTFGRIDIWVNNAGVAGPYGPTVEIAPAEFERVLRTNLFGTYYGSLVALRHFLPQRSGKLINILGHGERGPVAYQNAYASSKAWVRNFTLALAKEHVGSGVGIFAFQPGLMTTELLFQVDVVAGHESRLKAFPTVIRLLGKPPEVAARKVLWLAGPATDGKSGLYVRAGGPLAMLRGIMRALLRREAPPPLRLHVIPAATAEESR